MPELKELALTPFEEYLFVDNTPAHPVNCYSRLRFSGRFDRSALDAALREMLVFHPLLRSRIEETGRNRFRWAPLPESDWPRIRWSTTLDAPGPFPRGRSFDLKNEAGFGLHLVEHPDGHSDCFFEMHHAVADGMGIFGFLNDLFEVYHLRTGPASSGQTEEQAAGWYILATRTDLDRLAHRDPLIETPLVTLRPAAAIHRLFRAFKFIWFRPGPLLHFPADKPWMPNTPLPHPSYPAMETVVLDRERSASIREQARRNDTSLTDWLLASFARAVYLYRRDIGGAPPKRRLRFGIPMNLRTAGDASLPAANKVTILFFDRRFASLAEKPRFLRSIRAERDRLRKSGASHLLLHLLATFKRISGDLTWTARKRCWMSTVFTHLGDPFFQTRLPRHDGKIVLGDPESEHPLILEEIHSTPPLRPSVATVACTQHYAGRLMLGIHYEGSIFTKEETEKLLKLFVQESEG